MLHRTVETSKRTARRVSKWVIRLCIKQLVTGVYSNITMTSSASGGRMILGANTVARLALVIKFTSLHASTLLPKCKPFIERCLIFTAARKRWDIWVGFGFFEVATITRCWFAKWVVRYLKCSTGIITCKRASRFSSGIPVAATNIV